MKIYIKSFLGSLIAYLFNYHISNIKLSSIRSFFLKLWLLEFKSNAVVGEGVFILNGRKLIIKDKTFISEGCFLDGKNSKLKLVKMYSLERIPQSLPWVMIFNLRILKIKVDMW